MASNDIVRARIDREIKEEASTVLSEMRLSVSDAIRLLLMRIAVDKKFSFDLNRTNHKIESVNKQNRYRNKK
jgi:DNA-damage-inducible protein J